MNLKARSQLFPGDVAGTGSRDTVLDAWPSRPKRASKVNQEGNEGRVIRLLSLASISFLRRFPISTARQ